MSTIDKTAVEREWQGVKASLLRVVFGDRQGLAVFLGGLCFFLLYWRVGVFITDTNALLNTLVNVADGHLYIDRAPFGSGKIAPGTYVYDGRAYGRNYAMIFATLPVYLGLEALSGVFDPGLLVVGAFPMALAGFLTVLGIIVGRERLSLVGAGLGLVAFAMAVPLAAPIDSVALPIIAFQIVTMVAAAMTAVFMYRLVGDIHGSSAGLLSASAVVLGTPIAFWAAFPKRHSFTVLLVFVTAYALYRSRVDTTTEVRYRCFAYATVGLMTWIHAALALALFLPLLVVDLSTAERTDRRSLGIIALAFLLSLVPFFLTNAAISGNPIQPPRMLTPYDMADEAVPLSTGGSSTTLFGNSVVGQVLNKGVGIASVFGSLLVEGAVVAITEPDRLYSTFLRSGFMADIAEKDHSQAISLTVLESAPILGAIVAVPVLAGRRLRGDNRSEITAYASSPRGVVDLFGLGCAVLVFLIYIPRLPLHAQVTVRYLHPLYPLGIYALARTEAVRSVAVENWRPALWAYLTGTLVGGQLLVIAFAVFDLGFGESIQLHALLALATATLLAIWAGVSSVSDQSIPDRYGAAAMGLTLAASTTFVLIALLWHFDYASVYAVPALGELVEALSLV